MDTGLVVNVNGFGLVNMHIFLVNVSQCKYWVLIVASVPESLRQNSLSTAREAFVWDKIYLQCFMDCFQFGTKGLTKFFK